MKIDAISCTHTRPQLRLGDNLFTVSCEFIDDLFISEFNFAIINDLVESLTYFDHQAIHSPVTKQNRTLSYRSEKTVRLNEYRSVLEMREHPTVVNYVNKHL